MWQRILLLAGLVLSVSASAHGGKSHDLPGSIQVPAERTAAVQQSGPGATELEQALNLSPDVAAQLNSLIVDHKARLQRLLSAYVSTDDKERRQRLSWLMQRASEHHQRQLANLLSPTEVVALSDYLQGGIATVTR